MHSNDYAQALANVDAAIALDHGFLAAQILREEIVERMHAQPVEMPSPSQPAGDIKSSARLTTTVTPAARPTRETEPASRSTRVKAARLIGLASVLMLMVRLASVGTIKVAKPSPPSPAVVVPARAPIAVFAARVATARPAPAAASAPLWTSPRLTQLDVRPHWRAPRCTSRMRPCCAISGKASANCGSARRRRRAMRFRRRHRR